MNASNRNAGRRFVPGFVPAVVLASAIGVAALLYRSPEHKALVTAALLICFAVLIVSVILVQNYLVRVDQQREQDSGRVRKHGMWTVLLGIALNCAIIIPRLLAGDYDLVALMLVCGAAAWLVLVIYQRRQLR